MKLDKRFSVENFSHYYNHNKDLPHSIKLVVDDIILDVNKFVLCSWSQEFVVTADEASEIFLTKFSGYKEEVKECVDMLHGKEVTVDFTNIPVILKFAVMFKIPEMIDSTMMWAQQNISLNTLVNIVTINCDLHKIDFKSDHLMEIIRNFIVENTECRVFGMSTRHFGDYTESLVFAMLTRHFDDDLTVLMDILIYDGPFVNNCIAIFNSKIRAEYEYEYLMKKLENVSDRDNEEILLEKLMDKVMKEVKNPLLRKQFLRFSRRLPADQGASGSGISSSGNRIQFQWWRTFSKEELLNTKRNYGIKDYEYAVICVDWIEINKPPGGDVLDLYKSIQLENLSFSFFNTILDILYHTRDSYQSTIRAISKSYNQGLAGFVECEFDEQSWQISKQELLDCLVNEQPVQLTYPCGLSSCELKTQHSVNIRLESTSERLRVDVDLPSFTHCNEHTHDLYVYIFWYSLCYNSSDYSDPRLVSFYTMSCREIVELVTVRNYFSIRCLVRKRPLFGV